MTNDILIRTYAGDKDWLFYCLKSLIKFSSKFRNILVICPPESTEAIRPVANRLDVDFAECKQLNKDDYVGQMATKMHYDEFTDADLITHVDSDMIFSEEYDSSHLINKDGKVIIGKQEYAQLTVPWKPVTEKFVGFEVTWEYNRIYPSVYPRWLYKETREIIDKVAGKSFDETISEVELRQFSECNALGAVAEKHFPDKFDFRDVARDPIPARPCTCYWSWNGLSDDIRKKIEEIL